MLTCQFCGYTEELESDVFQLDPYKKGFWCENCDGYTYLNNQKNKHKFTLILEDKYTMKTSFQPLKLKLAKRLSPFRYPIGKSKIIDYLFTYLQESNTKTLISPFSGGASFELAMLNAGIVEKIHLNDIDTGVFSVWWTIKHMPYALIERIQSIKPTHSYV